MQTALQVDISYDEIFSLVKQLPAEQKLRLSKELEKEGIYSKLADILQDFKTDELIEEMITEEVEMVRQKRYESEKH